MSLFPLKPTHAPVKAYYAALARFHQHGHTTEGNTRSAFADLLKRCCTHYDWHLVEEYQFKGTNKQPLRADGALVDALTLVHGYWEAKDTSDDLQKEIKAKVNKGYPLTNILFQSPDRAVLYQDNRIAFDGPITAPEKLVEVLQLFFEHQQADIPDWKSAVEQFSDKIADLAGVVENTLAEEDGRNPRFHQAFESFLELCRQSINPDLTRDAVRKMLIQHLLTVRIFTRVFHNEDFVRKNVIAAEIEKVIDTITARYFSRSEFLKPLDRFYTAIERAAESQTGYTEKQHFLNAVYEKFFQRFDRKQADTHGIVYTPQPIVDFMVRSVEEILKQEFGKSLSDPGVHILDPFTGTGNFIVRIMQEIKRSALPQKYAEELHCNEIMLLPYYIASMNIEHAYMERAGEYKSFEGICLVDTFDMRAQTNMFAEANSARIEVQMSSPIYVAIGNPPYNARQESESDNNKNRRYKDLDQRISETYAKSSLATNKNSLSDPYIKAFRWASDRIADEGIIAFVTNSGFLESASADGVRKHLAGEFDSIYLVDLGGNVRKDPSLSGTMHNVFQIQVGVCINLLVRRKGEREKRMCTIRYSSLPQKWTRGQKHSFLDTASAFAKIDWKSLQPDARGNWLNSEQSSLFANQVPVGDIWKVQSRGIASSRDAYNYNHSLEYLRSTVALAIDLYNEMLERYRRQSVPRPKPEEFVDTTDPRIKWTRQTKNLLHRLVAAELCEEDFRTSLYRPFRAMHFYFQDFWNEERYQLQRVFPQAVSENVLICVSGVASERPFATFVSSAIPDLNFFGPGTVPKWLPFYIYDRKGKNRQENITDSALTEFRTHYSDQTITKWDIFHATYAILHNPEYRTRYAANLKRELPRIPFPPDFHAYARAGKRLMELHIEYEQQPEYPLKQIEHPTAEVSFRVEKMKLSKDKSELRYNDFLLLRGIPTAAFDYRLGNRSALEWVIDQYRVTVDPRSGIRNDPNRPDDEKYILRLIGQVINVSLETQQIIAALPSLNLPTENASTSK